MAWPKPNGRPVYGWRVLPALLMPGLRASVAPIRTAILFKRSMRRRRAYWGSREGGGACLGVRLAYLPRPPATALRGRWLGLQLVMGKGVVERRTRYAEIGCDLPGWNSGGEFALCQLDTVGRHLPTPADMNTCCLGCCHARRDALFDKLTLVLGFKAQTVEIVHYIIKSMRCVAAR